MEDDAALSMMLKELFEGEGYEVVVARDGQRALQLGFGRHFVVLVFDRGFTHYRGA
ncbi:hypothetical protein [Arthrobacter sp. AG1021]|uniref:hypothetical protein n=1 Tax=Arthrobacter sp. AG1021 TaxID=2183908 RepID=UPI002570E9F9|nr:hypothetical protein [Arthrobacter sp. AG1021]